MSDTIRDFVPKCPLPRDDTSRVLLGHGGGGRLMHRLIEETIVPGLDDAKLQAHHDGAVMDLDGTRLAFTTDSHVVSPLFFPGGDMARSPSTGPSTIWRCAGRDRSTCPAG